MNPKSDDKIAKLPTTREKPGAFLADIAEIRRRARQHIGRGAVTEGDKADRETAIRILNEALATEIVCALRYKRHHYMDAGSILERVSNSKQELRLFSQEHTVAAGL